jgi:hypothetical protein
MSLIIGRMQWKCPPEIGGHKMGVSAGVYFPTRIATERDLTMS